MDDARPMPLDHLALLVAARREAELRILQRRLEADVRAGLLPVAAIACFDQWRAGGARGWRGWPGLHQG